MFVLFKSLYKEEWKWGFFSLHDFDIYEILSLCKKYSLKLNRVWRKKRSFTECWSWNLIVIHPPSEVRMHATSQYSLLIDRIKLHINFCLFETDPKDFKPIFPLYSSQTDGSFIRKFPSFWNRSSKMYYKSGYPVSIQYFELLQTWQIPQQITQDHLNLDEATSIIMNFNMTTFEFLFSFLMRRANVVFI